MSKPIAYIFVDVNDNESWVDNLNSAEYTLKLGGLLADKVCNSNRIITAYALNNDKGSSFVGQIEQAINGSILIQSLNQNFTDYTKDFRSWCEFIDERYSIL